MEYHIPEKEKWEFDETVTNIFDDMLARSIPQYEVMRNAVTNIACRHAKKSGHVLDLGCSRGDQLQRMISSFGCGCHYHGVEISEPMYQACVDKFKDFLNVKLYNLDLRKDFPKIQGEIDVCLSILTLQFIPIEYRHHLLRKIYNNLNSDGVLIVVEKVLGNTAEIDDFMVNEYYNLKHQNGYSVYEIERKRLSLEGVLVPVTAKWNEELLHNSGFSQVDCFWRWMNFSGWVAKK